MPGEGTSVPERAAMGFALNLSLNLNVTLNRTDSLVVV